MQKLEGRLQTTVRKRGHYKSKNGQKTEQHHIWRSDAGGAKLKGEAKDLSDLCASNPVVKINALAGVMVPLKHQQSNINRISNLRNGSPCNDAPVNAILIYVDPFWYILMPFCTTKISGQPRALEKGLGTPCKIHQIFISLGRTRGGVSHSRVETWIDTVPSVLIFWLDSLVVLKSKNRIKGPDNPTSQLLPIMS
jgi:hypothetical protein